MALPVSPCGTPTAGTALDQAGIFDALSESMGDHLIVPIDHGRQLVLLPDQPAAIALLWRFEHKAQSGIVALLLNAGKSSATAAEAHAAGLARTHPVECRLLTTG